MTHKKSAQQASAATYIPGVCNIGPAERRKRRQSGMVALVMAIVMYVVLLDSGLSKSARLLLILPVTASALGFLQNAFHFCVAYGAKGLYNVMNNVGETSDVTTETYRRKDREKVVKIVGLSFAIGAIVAGLSLL